MRRDESNRSFRMGPSILRLPPFPPFLSILLFVLIPPAISSTSLGAQERPDFSGAWTSTSQGRSGGAGGGGAMGSLGSGWGSSFTIEQDANLLTITRVFFSRGDLQPPIRYRFAIDGSETRNEIMMGRGMQEQLSTTSWDGDRLVITTLSEVGEGTGEERILSETTHTLSLQPPSAGRAAWPPSLIVETVRGGVLGGSSSTTRTVYSRN